MKKIISKFILPFVALSPVSYALAQSSQSLFQVATFTSLLQGVYNGDYSFSQLSKHGNFGLGTFDVTNGEMVAIDGNFYQILQDGRAHKVSPKQDMPFAQVVYFKEKPSFDLSNIHSSAALAQLLQKRLKNQNIPYAIRITGTFEMLHLRSLTKQKRPFRPLNETYKTQAEYTFHNVKGTIVGFWFPEYLGKINVPGFHFHFISNDRLRGGHVLNASVEHAVVAIQPIYSLQIQMPKTTEFRKADLNGDHEKQIRKIESASVRLK